MNGPRSAQLRPAAQTGAETVLLHDSVRSHCAVLPRQRARLVGRIQIVLLCNGPTVCRVLSWLGLAMRLRMLVIVFRRELPLFGLLPKLLCLLGIVVSQACMVVRIDHPLR
jgi:hypothetical protein